LHNTVQKLTFLRYFDAQCKTDYPLNQWLLTFSTPGMLFLKLLAWGLVWGYVISQSGGRCCLCM